MIQWGIELSLHKLPVPPLATNPHLQVPPEKGSSLLTPSHIELVVELHSLDELVSQMHSVPVLQTGFSSVQPVCGSEVEIAQTAQVPSAWHFLFESEQVP